MTVRIKVLGPGCANCERLEANVREAVLQAGLEATIDKVKDPAVFAHYGLLFTPGLVVDDKLVAGGRIPGVPEIMTWLANTGVARPAAQ